jgi:hypothetical protein
MTKQETINDKIRKLLAVGSKDSGATESERDTALQMAAVMMARHGINQDEIGTGSGPKAKVGNMNTDRMIQWKIYSAMAAAALYGCQVILHSKGLKGIQFIGRPDNLDATEETFAWIMAQINLLYKPLVPSHLKGNYRSAWVDKFRVACAVRVLHRAQESIREITTPSAKGAALVPVGYFKQLAAENEAAAMEAYPKTKAVKVGGIGKWTDGSAAGHKAGDHVKLRREAEGQKVSGLLN